MKSLGRNRFVLNSTGQLDVDQDVRIRGKAGDYLPLPTDVGNVLATLLNQCGKGACEFELEFGVTERPSEEIDQSWPGALWWSPCRLLNIQGMGLFCLSISIPLRWPVDMVVDHATKLFWLVHAWDEQEDLGLQVHNVKPLDDVRRAEIFGLEDTGKLLRQELGLAPEATEAETMGKLAELEAIGRSVLQV